MIRHRLCRSCGLIPVVATLVACAGNTHEWTRPDWAHLERLGGDRGFTPESIVPRAELPDPGGLPDLSTPGSHDLSIEHAVFIALRQNRDLRVASFSPVIAGAFEEIEQGRFDPEFFADANLAREESSETSRSTGGQFSVRGNDADGAIGIRQTLPTGATVTFDVSESRDISNRAPEQQQARIGLTVTQALLRGAGSVFTLASVRQAELETEISKHELRGVVEALLAETETAYWNYLLAQRKIAIVEESLDIAKRQADQLLQRIEIGVLPRTEAAAARGEVALREQALIDATSELRAARLRLLRLLGAPLGLAATTEIAAVSRPGEAGETLGEIADRLALARLRRPDLSEARLRLDQNRLETIRTRNGLLPRLDLFISLGKTGYADTFGGAFRDLDGSTFDVTVGVSVAQSLGRTAAGGAYRAAVASRDQAAEAIANLEELIELDVRLAATEVDRSRQQIAATATTRELQEETVRAELERLDVGSSTALLVAQAQRDLLEAQIAEVEAIANHRVALIGLYLAEGSLLDRRGVSIGSLSEPAR